MGLLLLCGIIQYTSHDMTCASKMAFNIKLSHVRTMSVCFIQVCCAEPALHDNINIFKKM